MRSPAAEPPLPAGLPAPAPLPGTPQSFGESLGASGSWGEVRRAARWRMGASVCKASLVTSCSSPGKRVLGWAGNAEGVSVRRSACSGVSFVQLGGVPGKLRQTRTVQVRPLFTGELCFPTRTDVTLSVL